MSWDGIVRIEMTAVALTPVHVGDGTDWTPEAFYLDGHQLCRFTPARVLAGMGVGARARYASALDRGELAVAQAELRRAAQDATAEERIAVSGASRGDLERALNDPGRSGAVKAFVRSGGRPYLPGSTLKGAFRTALASQHLPAGRERDGIAPPGDAEAMRLALGVQPNDTARDPLRFLAIADAALPDGATMVDMPEIMRGGHRGEARFEGIRMHAERLCSYADGGRQIKFDLTLTINAAAMAGAHKRGEIARTYDRPGLFDAVNRFHWDIWRRERERFYSGLPASTQRMEAMLRRLPHPSGGTLAEHGPVGVRNMLLLRVGRFGHFESKSLAGVRQGFVPQAKGNKWRGRDEFGSTRTVIRIPGKDERRRDESDQRIPVPFGWVLAWMKKQAAT